MQGAWIRAATPWLTAAWLATGCTSERGADPSRDAGRDAGAPESAVADASFELDGSLDAASDAGLDLDASIEEPDAHRDAAPDADDALPDAQVVSVAFQPLTVRTDGGQTVALLGLTGITFLPGNRGALVWEKAGRLKHLRVEGDDLVLLGELQLSGVYDSDDCGLVSVALDPDWETNHYLFASHCTSGRFSAVVRYTFDGGDYDAVAETASPVIEAGDSTANRPWHNFGALGFFEDHSMWLLSGEKNIRAHGQDVASELGKVLRIIPRRGEELSGYDPHPGNPFAGDPELSSGANVYAWGLRSPWRGTIDRDGRLIIGDVGETHEEVNVAQQAGQNFGWSAHNGPCDEDCEGVTDPVVWWGRSSSHEYVTDDEHAGARTARVSWVGEYYPGGEDDPYDGFLDDTVLFSDTCIGFVRALQIDARGKAARDDHVGHLSGLSGAAIGPGGFLYVTSFGGCTSTRGGVRGGIYRIEPRTEEDEPVITMARPEHPLLEDPLGPLPLVLSDTGLFTDEALATASPRAFAYEPTLALWSNGSAKERYVVLPEGEQIDNRDRRAWDFPPGTLFFKTFAFATVDEPERRVETRVIRRTATGYDYHAYKWHTDGRDADLIPLAKSLGVDVQLSDEETVRHAIPSELDCRSCHESDETVVIGFDELRLSGPRGGETASQLDLLARAGLFEVAPPAPEARDAVEHDDASTREVLGYLHGNCAHCHNTSPQTMSALSLEHEVALSNIIEMPTVGSGQAAGIRVVPGSSADSVLFQAFAGEDELPGLQPMPPIGVQRIDAVAVELLRAWIDSL
jgi:glucose/arabinose dehydrogenase